MKKIGIFYGSSTGATEEVAQTIATKLNIETENVHEVSEISEEAIAPYEILLLGSSTWGAGDLQDDWYDAIDVIKDLDLSSKTIALFGCGDCEEHGETFCGALGKLYEELSGTGCKFAGKVSASEYTFESSDSVVDDMFVGLALDETNESDKTEERIDQWTENLKNELGL